MEVFMFIIIAVIVLVILYFLANEFYKVAKEKGFYERKYFWIAFLFNVMGYLLVIALPDRNVTRGEATTKRNSENQETMNFFSSGAMNIPKRKNTNNEV